MNTEISLFQRYIKQQPEAVDLIGSSFQNVTHRKRAVHIAKERKLSSELAGLLRDQNSDLGHSPSREKNLVDLTNGQAVAVLTGQQVGLFSGPVLTFYKIASAIATAAELQRETGVRAVPVFWLQNEDHDFAEVNQCWLPDLQGRLTKLQTLPTASLGDKKRVSLKYRLLGPSVMDLLEKLEEYASLFEKRFPGSGATTASGATTFLDILQKHYTPRRSFSESFSRLVSELFSDEGLLVFDPRHTTASSLMQPFFIKAFEKHRQISQSLLSQSQKLRDLGMEPQVHVRESSPLFFLHQGTQEGERFRLETNDLDNNNWSLIGREASIKEEELVSLLKTAPERFSSTALLRPLIQDALFPTAAYLAGPAEVNYYGQLNPIYKLFELPRPLVVPRARFVCLEENTAKLLKQLRLKAEDLHLPEHDLLEKLAELHGGTFADPNELRDKAASSIEKIMAELSGKFGELDKTLIGSVDKASEKMLGQLDRLRERYLKALASYHDINQKRLKRLQIALFPNGTMQERVYGLVYFYGRYGPEFKKRIMENIQPFSPEIQEIYL